MRRTLAILLCKILHWVGGLIGKGSSLPGQIALKLCPDVLSRVQLPAAVIAVTGSNGKTSTTEMIASILAEAGKKVVWNKEGSNQIEGITTLLLTNCTLGGAVRGDVLLLESDERYARHTFKWFHPTHFVITNLYRDQLTRNGHQEWVYQAIQQAVFPETTLLLNADDPLVSRFAQGHPADKVRWFGLEKSTASTREHHGIYHDGLRCPVCFGPMTYSIYHYAHVGHYKCTSCGYQRQQPQYAGTELNLDEGVLTVNGKTTIQLAFKSIYNVYNILASWAACAEVGVPEETIAHALNSYILKNGRMVSFTLGGRKGVLLTSKHENSVAYDTNLAYIAAQKQPCEVMLIVDAISRKYFTGETSWLWDIDFNQLAVPQVEKVWLCGKYVNDLAMRMDYTDVPEDKLVLRENIAQAAEELRREGTLPLYVATCFSDRDKLLAHVVRD